ncbi:MAG: cupredoxin domain-containing protein [Candidatus Saccharimonadales bacterium]
MDTLLVLLGSGLLIGLIVWWFFMKPDSEVVVVEGGADHQSVTITVDGGYTPQKIQLRKGVPATLIFHRKDASSCFDEVVLPDFGVSTKLPVNKDFVIKVQPDKPGRYTYSCGMHMFFGEVIVK